ncbi:MAG: segregation/condensation protein A [Acidimicrobiaceae bacterium]|nr:segregation/condensation protein A [Acidimicrobiaceae bacterium]
MPYKVHTAVFDGPFDLLLHLITRQQVDLWEVSLSSIVDAYVATLEEMKALDLEVATEFLLIASVLLELKTRRLLPSREDIELDEELALWEERDLLLARLLEAKTFKDAAATMSGLMDRAGRSWPRTAGLEERFVGLAPDLLEGVTAERLAEAMRSLGRPRPVAGVDLDHVAPIRASVADAVAELAMQLPSLGRTTFGRLCAGIGERLEVIVRFLALLEMYKQGVVELDQPTSFSELVISWVGGEGVGGDLVVEEYQG